TCAVRVLLGQEFPAPVVPPWPGATSRFQKTSPPDIFDVAGAQTRFPPREASEDEGRPLPGRRRVEGPQALHRADLPTHLRLDAGASARETLRLDRSQGA